MLVRWRKKAVGHWFQPLFLFLNFSVSSVKILFVSRLTYFFFLVFLFLFLRRYNLEKVLRLTVAGTSAIIFIYGILQKFVLFPIYLKTISPQEDFYTQAMITRIKGGRIFSIFPLPTLYAIICTVLILFIFTFWFHVPPQLKNKNYFGEYCWRWDYSTWCSPSHSAASFTYQQGDWFIYCFQAF